MKKKVEVASNPTGKELKHYYCHECGTHHEKGSPIWIEHHPKLRKLSVKEPDNEQKD